MQLRENSLLVLILANLLLLAHSQKCDITLYQRALWCDDILKAPDLSVTMSRSPLQRTPKALYITRCPQLCLPSC